MPLHALQAQLEAAGVLQPGQYEYPFQFTLHPHTPATFRCGQNVTGAVMSGTDPAKYAPGCSVPASRPICCQWTEARHCD